MKTHLRLAAASGLLFALLANFPALQAQSQPPDGVSVVPRLVKYSGTATDADGKPRTGVAGITLALYKDQQGGAPLWTETQNIRLDSAGHYIVALGASKPDGVPAELFSSGEARWLGIQLDDQAEQPRVSLLSVPYALKAGDAETLGGKPLSAFVLAGNSSSDTEVVAGKTISSQTVASKLNGVDTTAKKAGLFATMAGPTNFSGSTTDQIVGVMQNGIGVGVNAIAGAGKAIVGTSTSGIGVSGSAVGNTGYTTGVEGYVDSPSGTAGVFINAANGKILSGWNSSFEAFNVDASGNVNSVSGVYQIGGSNVLGIGQAADHNVFLGQGAGAHNTPGAGQANTFSGASAGANNTSACCNTFTGYQSGNNNTSGYQNTFTGTFAGFTNVTGNGNTFFGHNAGYFNTAGGNSFYGAFAGAHNSTGTSNVFSGYTAGYNNTTGGENTFSGYAAGHSNTSGAGNTFDGYQAGYMNTTGEGNFFAGYQAGYSNITGGANVFIGISAGSINTIGGGNVFSGATSGGSNTAGNDNTFIGNQAGSANVSGNGNTYIGNRAGQYNAGDNNIYVGNNDSYEESNTIRIGTITGLTGYGPQTKAYIAGVAGSTVTGVPVYINSFTGQLGVTSSSRRFKEQIADMGESTNALMKLRPVTFLYKPEYANGDRSLQYGLIAEEVAQVYPELVAYDNDGKPYTVRYQYLASMLLNEFQKQYRRFESQADIIQAQQREIESLKLQLQQRNASLEERLQKLESHTPSQMKTACDVNLTTASNAKGSL